MKLSSVIISAAAIGLSALSSVSAQQTQPACSSIYTRQELLSLSSSQWNLVKAILSAMQRDGWFGWFAYIHNTYFGQIHGNSQFFPFHRRFVYEWESIGKRYNPGYIQPYWDEMRDYRAPATSQVLTPNWVGGNGVSPNWCVQNGNQAGWTMTFPNNHCFQRNYGNNGNLGSWYSPEYINSMIQRDTTMARFRPDIEYSLHGVVHINIGGDMYQGYSPNDWIFFLHHANLDRLWWQWQVGGRMWTMDGPNYDGSNISLNSNMPQFNEPISSVMQLGYGKMCYQYASNPLRRRDLGADLQQRLIQTLPKNTLAAWFPQTAKTPAAVNLIASVPANNETSNGQYIPYPTPLTKEWLEMHFAKPGEVQHVEADARKFVDAMRAAGYKSPY
ncbi:hypothetical protein GGI25_005357 [Coemansia spiralis]|uniref:Tyrosinase copper-binding domain-containing protein n=2 Tax=Coemansia TaxID=4863 RepID=A0A9W8G4N9_9FUNG|nr:hypothetical protein EDC05_005331 [Coemansia umbellata]KAJ2619685.1 hypothetical protein GGI26_005637 [Coemansia sp. RSA 1358]KAJ2671806.1 hypothetical protein GGI25_005357 [Coemansia spiralis]